MTEFTHYEMISTPGGKKANEDHSITFKQFAWVIDGATPVTNKQHFSEISDAHWFSQKLSDEILLTILEYKDKNVDLTLESLLKKGMQRLDKVSKKELDRSYIPNYEQPSAAGVFLVLKGEELFYSIFSDCSLVILKNDGSIDVISDTKINAFSDKTLALYIKAKEENLSDDETKQKIQPVLKENRSFMNQPNGYTVLSLDGNGLKYAVSGKIPVKEVNSVILCSDGFSRIVDLFEAYTWEEVIHGENLATFMGELRKLEEKTDDRYPRIKQSDDATVLRINFP